MKRISIFLLNFLLVFNLLACTSENADAKTIINLQIDNPVMTVNGQDVDIDADSDASPVVIDDRTLVPIRAVIENLGGSVSWEESTKTVTLQMGSDVIELTIGSKTAYLNGTFYELDVAPAIVDGRTMLPIRFIAEGFNLVVDWDSQTRTVTITKNDDETGFSFSAIPKYSGKAYVAVNDNIPFFTENEITSTSFEEYAELDYLGRCGICIASVSTDIMPTEERESISSVTPSGWQSIKMSEVSGGHLYNRCHLIGFQLTAENANDNNLITGTRYLNVDGMLPFENMVADYVKETNNHVMYRATPYFEGDNLVASGVLLEGYSVEDEGEGISFCVYCYNVQPGVEINYKDGSAVEAKASESEVDKETKQVQSVGNDEYFILNINSKKVHIPSCSGAKRIKEENKEISYESIDDILAKGFEPCGTCKPQ